MDNTLLKMPIYNYNEYTKWEGDNEGKRKKQACWCRECGSSLWLKTTSPEKLAMMEISRKLPWPPKYVEKAPSKHMKLQLRDVINDDQSNWREKDEILSSIQLQFAAQPLAVGQSVKTTEHQKCTLKDGMKKYRSITCLCQ